MYNARTLILKALHPIIMSKDINIHRYQHRRSPDDPQLSRVIYGSIDDFLASEILGKAVHTIYGEALPLDIYANIRIGMPLVVSFSGATPKGSITTLPFFSLRRTVGELGFSHISFSDPSLHLDPQLRIAWYGGTKELQLQTLIPLLIAKMLAGAKPKNIMFVGGSAGGFAALYFSHLFPQSVCVAWNPQTNLLAYNKELLAQYCSPAFGLETREAIELRLSEFIVCDLTIREGIWTSCRPILYLQNARDHHVEGHLVPLLRNICDSWEPGLQPVSQIVNENICLLMKDWGEGHFPPPKTFLRAALMRLAACEGDLYVALTSCVSL
jgi:hypothetical protein